MKPWVAAARWGALAVFLGGMGLGLALGATPGATQILVIAFVAYAAVGWLVTGRNPGNPIGWLFLAVAALTGVGAVSDGMVRYALAAGDPASLIGRWGAWLAAWFWFPLVCCATLFTLLLFPDGVLTRRWRPVLWVSIATCGLLTVAGALSPEVYAEGAPSAAGRCLTDVIPKDGVCGYQVDNPIGVPPALGAASWGNAVGVLLATSLATCVLLAVLSVVLRFRRARGVQRLQMRWFAFAAVLVAMWVLVTIVTPSGTTDPLWREIGMAVVIALIPVSCGIAIMRYHLYDIDRIISRTVSYAIVTGVLLAVYAGIVISASHVLNTESPVVVAGATLAAAALARPVLRRVQVVVDRRFNRARFDAQETVEEFGHRLRNELAAEQVVDDLRVVIGDTLQPSTLSTWIAPQGGGR